MGLPEGSELFVLVAGLPLLYLLMSIGYRRLLSRWLPEPVKRPPDVDEPAGPGELRCPLCGAINDADFEKCYGCAGRLPTEPLEEDPPDGSRG